MFFDGLITPKRVVSLSGASSFSRNAGANRQRFEFRSVQLERERASRQILRFLRYVVDFKRNVLPQRDSLPSLFDSAERYLEQLTKSSDRNPQRYDDDTCVNGKKTALNRGESPTSTPSKSPLSTSAEQDAQPTRDRDSASKTTTSNASNGSKERQHCCSGVSSDAVSLHPICRIIRVVTALTRYDWSNDYAGHKSRCLRLFRRWYTESKRDGSIDFIISTPILKAQFINLCCKFLRTLLPRVDSSTLIAPYNANSPTTPGSSRSGISQQPRGESAHKTWGIYSSPVGGGGNVAMSSTLSATHSPSFPATNAFAGAPYSQKLSASRVTSIQSGRSGGISPRSTDNNSEVTDYLSLSSCRNHLDISSAPLSDSECDTVYYVTTIFGLLSEDEQRTLCADYGIIEKWYPVMLGRAFVNSRVNHTVFDHLLGMGTSIRNLCRSKEAAIQLFVNFWVVPNLVAGSYNISELLKVSNATIIPKFVHGLCCVGCPTVIKQSFGSIVEEESDANKPPPQKVRIITQNLEKSLRTYVSMVVSLNSTKWSRVSDTLQMQVEAILKAVDFLAFTQEAVWHAGVVDSCPSTTMVKHVEHGPTISNGNITTVNIDPISHNTVVNQGAIQGNGDSSIKGLVYQRLFSNMFHLLRSVNSQRNVSCSRDTIASALSVMLMCMQFVKEVDRATFCDIRSRGYVDTMGRILYAYKTDVYIVLTTVLLLVPLSQWDYFTTDMDSLIIANSRCALGNPDSFLDDPHQTPEIDGHIANLLVSCEVPSTLIKQFRQHYTECCNSNFAHFIASLSAETSNNGTFSHLWHIFSLVLSYCLKIMHDSEIIGDQGNNRGVVDMANAVFLANTLNHFYWNEVSPPRPTKDHLNFETGANFPGNSICHCGIEVKMNTMFHVPKRSPFDTAYWGILARKFNERFFRIPDPQNRSLLISDVERTVLSQMKIRQLDAPMLSAVEYIPQTISFDTRLELFMQRVAHDRVMYRNEYNEFFDFALNVIRRTHIVEDGLNTLGYLSGFQLKQPFKVIFVDETGVREEGIDGGGLFKEFLTSLCTVIFDPAYGIFEESPYDRSFAPSPNSSLVHEDHLVLFNFVGKVVGKALYEHILIEPVLSRLLLNLILKIRNTLDDFKLFDPELYRNITSMRDMTAEEIESLGLTFTTAISSLDNTVQAEIVDGGSNIKVTKENLESFIHHFADFKCNRLIEAQSSAFLQGLSAIIPLEWLKMFSPDELVFLISGSAEDIDITDMKAHTLYSGGYTSSSAVVIWFWEIMSEFNNEMRRAFLWFVTCCKRAPLLGFKQLQPMFCITRDLDTCSMPTVSTCTNLLKLPEYGSKSELKSKLINAMTMSKGFGIA